MTSMSKLTSSMRYFATRIPQIEPKRRNTMMTKTKESLITFAGKREAICSMEMIVTATSDMLN